MFHNKMYQTLVRDRAWETNTIEMVWRKSAFFCFPLLIEIFPAQRSVKGKECPSVTSSQKTSAFDIDR